MPGVAIVGREDGMVEVELADGADDQALLDAARRTGRVTRFEPVRPRLAEIFRDVIRQ